MNPIESNSSSFIQIDEQGNVQEEIQEFNPMESTSSLQQHLQFNEQEILNVEEILNEEEQDEQEELTTVKDVQNAINISHPFGLKIWKPALYRKSRSVNQTAWDALHSTPGVVPAKKLYLSIDNLLWLLFFGWWLCISYLMVAYCLVYPLHLLGFLLECMTCLICQRISAELHKAKEYTNVLIDLAFYLLWPFGKYITRRKARSLDPEAQSLLSDPSTLAGLGIYESESHPSPPSTPLNPPKDTRKSHGFTSLYFYFIFFITLAPLHLLVSGICYFLVFFIPMAKLNLLLVKHMLRHPLELSTHKGFFSSPERITSTASSLYSRLDHLYDSIRPSDSPLWAGMDVDDHLSHDDYYVYKAVCIYNACGWKYYKYTIDGVNILVINLFALVVFTLVDFYYIAPRWKELWISSHEFMFMTSLFSIIPLAYFIGMAVSSITAQTGSIALGSVINATFGSIIEIILYCLAIMQGKERVVEGAITGSILCGLLALPGVAMFSGGMKRKEQTFNAKAAGVSTTMLVMAAIGMFSPTLFQAVYGAFEMKCQSCPIDESNIVNSCQTCTFHKLHPSKDPVYLKSTIPLIYICTLSLVLTYAIGLWFTLKTHSKTIYAPVKSSKKKVSVPLVQEHPPYSHLGSMNKPKLKSSGNRPKSFPTLLLQRGKRDIKSPLSSTLFVSIDPCTLSKEPCQSSTQASTHDSTSQHNISQSTPHDLHKIHDETESNPSSHSSDQDQDNNLHEGPNWSSIKSFIVLLGCTLLYSMIAEVLIDTVDGFLVTFPVDEKVLGLTLFAIAPTVTEFYNAISFALSGNIALSLEIGSAYVIQVALLQIPALVVFSFWWKSQSMAVTGGIYKNVVHSLLNLRGGLSLGNVDSNEFSNAIMSKAVNGFTLIFPIWDIISTFLALIILSYVYIEGKSNYFKGAMLLLTYVLLMFAFILVPS